MGCCMLIKTPQWENLAVFNVNVVCLTGLHRGKARVLLIEGKYSEERKDSSSAFLKYSLSSHIFCPPHSCT